MSITDLPTRAPARKVVAFTGGTLAGQVLADLLSWALSSLFNHGAALPGPPQRAIDYLVPVALGFVLAYFTPRGMEEVGPPTRGGEHLRRMT